MQNFDELIKQYANKVIDQDNPAVVKYVLKEAYRRRNINLQPDQPPEPIVRQKRRKQPVRTPYGDFSSIRAAILGSELCATTLYKYIKEKREGYEFL